MGREVPSGDDECHRKREPAVEFLGLAIGAFDHLRKRVDDATRRWVAASPIRSTDETSGGRPHHLCHKGFDASFGRIELRGAFENVGEKLLFDVLDLE